MHFPNLIQKVCLRLAASWDLVMPWLLVTSTRRRRRSRRAMNGMKSFQKQPACLVLGQKIMFICLFTLTTSRNYGCRREDFPILYTGVNLPSIGWTSNRSTQKIAMVNQIKSSQLKSSQLKSNWICLIYFPFFISYHLVSDRESCLFVGLLLCLLVYTTNFQYR